MLHSLGVVLFVGRSLPRISQMQFEFRCTTRRALVAGPWVQVGDEWVRYNISGTHPERAAYCFQSRVNPTFTPVAGWEV